MTESKNERRADSAALDLLFHNARSFGAWLDEPVSDDSLRALYDIARMGPTANNGCPLRLLFLRSAEAKEKLKPCLSPGNVDKTMAAPITAILAYDRFFFEHMDRLSPGSTAGARFVEDMEKAERIARLNATLQAAYVLMAARAIGLDCGPMGGFNPGAVDTAFFPDGRIKTFLLCNLGYGDDDLLNPRAFRFDFDEVCTLL